jgi:serine/threonine protein kinase
LSALFCGCPCCKKKDHEQIEEETRHGDVRDYYVIKEKLGAGGFAQVRRAQLKSEVEEEYAVKIWDQQSLAKRAHRKWRSAIASELRILAMCEHEHVVKYYELFKDDFFYYAIMELCSEPFMRVLEQRKEVSEYVLAHLALDMLSAIEYIHDLDIVHRDVKGDNFLACVMPERPGQISVKMIDFGLAVVMSHPRQKLRTQCGTVNYMSPELLLGSYGKPTDVWSYGIIVYTMVYGEFPFSRKATSPVKPHVETFMRILDSAPPEYFHANPDVSVSSQAEEFVKAILIRSPKNRPTAAALKEKASEWIGWARTMSSNVSVLSQRADRECDTPSSLHTTDDFAAREWRRDRRLSELQSSYDSGLRRGHKVFSRSGTRSMSAVPGTKSNQELEAIVQQLRSNSRVSSDPVKVDVQAFFVSEGNGQRGQGGQGSEATVKPGGGNGEGFSIHHSNRRTDTTFDVLPANEMKDAAVSYLKMRGEHRNSIDSDITLEQLLQSGQTRSGEIDVDSEVFSPSSATSIPLDTPDSPLSARRAQDRASFVASLDKLDRRLSHTSLTSSASHKSHDSTSLRLKSPRGVNDEGSSDTMVSPRSQGLSEGDSFQNGLFVKRKSHLSDGSTADTQVTATRRLSDRSSDSRDGERDEESSRRSSDTMSVPLAPQGANRSLGHCPCCRSLLIIESYIMVFLYSYFSISELMCMVVRFSSGQMTGPFTLRTDYRPSHVCGV